MSILDEHPEIYGHGTLADTIRKIERENTEMRNLLLRMEKFTLRDSVTPHSGNAYLRTKATEWEVFQQKIHDLLHPEPPVLLNMDLDPNKLRLRVWLEKGDEVKMLDTNVHYIVDDKGVLRLFKHMDQIWKDLGQ